LLEEQKSAGLNSIQKTVVYAPGTTVRVTQQIPRRIDTYSITVEGTVLRQERQGSGSWYARNKQNKVWLDRLIIQKTDGEITVLNLDEYTRVEVLTGAQPVVASSPMAMRADDASAGTT
jgi:hypothetical protein